MDWVSLGYAYLIGAVATIVFIEVLLSIRGREAKVQAELDRNPEIGDIPIRAVVLFMGVLWPLGWALWVTVGRADKGDRHE